jgi:hypothetical protein
VVDGFSRAIFWHKYRHEGEYPQQPIMSSSPPQKLPSGQSIFLLIFSMLSKVPIKVKLAIDTTK